MENNNEIEKLKEIAEYYNQKGENQLIRDIFANVIKQKAEGTLSNEQISAFAKKVGPLLTAEQRERLNSLVKQLLEL
jgi:hypothetical protein